MFCWKRNAFSDHQTISVCLMILSKSSDIVKIWYQTVEVKYSGKVFFYYMIRQYFWWFWTNHQTFCKIISNVWWQMAFCEQCFMGWLINITRWRRQMETFSALLAICAGNSPVTGEFPTQRPVTRSLKKTAHYDVTVMTSHYWHEVDDESSPTKIHKPVNTLIPEPNSHHLTNVSKCALLNGNCWIMTPQCVPSVELTAVQHWFRC